MIENGLANLDVNFVMWPLGIVKFFNIQQHFLAHLILHFASSGIDLFFIAFLGFLQQQLGLLQNLFTLFGQVLTILVEL